MNETKTYTLDEVMELLHFTRRTIYNYIKAGHLKAVKFGRFWRVREEDLIEFTKTGTKKKE